jgi:hypothetical protein
VDFSGIGMGLVSCCFVTLVPPIPAGIAVLAIRTIRKRQGLPTSATDGAAWFALLYVISFVVCCVFIYFSYLRYMYVM